MHNNYDDTVTALMDHLDDLIADDISDNEHSGTCQVVILVLTQVETALQKKV